MESRLLQILVCPLCKGPLHYEKQHQELVCRADRLAFPIRDGVPIMLEDQAREWDADSAGAPSQSTAPTAKSSGSDDTPDSSDRRDGATRQ